MTPSISRGLRSRRRIDLDPARIPPGQYVTTAFPVLSAGPIPHTPVDQWNFTIRGAVAEPVSWTWDQFRALPSQTITTDIHCVTKWTKLDTTWTGVALDTLLAAVTTTARYALVFSDGGYTTNVPIAELTAGQAMVAFSFEGQPLATEYGGPARLLVPHLYLWKSAKWVRGLELCDEDVPGFWEQCGCHIRGDPWQEQRFAGD